jgi:spore germination cell wall hydrolase CwlJ-like protein
MHHDLAIVDELRGVSCVRWGKVIQGIVGGPFSHRGLPVLTLGLAAFIVFPAQSGRSDIAAFLSGMNSGGQNIYLTASPAGSIQQADLVFKDPMTTGSLQSSAGLELPNGGKIAFRGTAKPEQDTPDEDRVTRDLKKGRVIAVTPVSPPLHFSAGSIMDQTSFLYRPVTKMSAELAFNSKAGAGNQVQVAANFSGNSNSRPDPSVPAEIASLVNNRKADVLATAYATADAGTSRKSPFDYVLKKNDEQGRFVPDIGPNDHAWAASVLPASVFSDKEQNCLTRGIYFESRGEILKGQAAVAQVILNRVRNPAFPDTVCGVVFQNENWRHRCQFSFACDNILDRILNHNSWKTAHDIALAVTAGKIWLPKVGSATHYHAISVHPAWARHMKRVTRIGDHIFYRTYGGGWS